MPRLKLSFITLLLSSCLSFLDCGNLTDPLNGWVALPQITAEDQIAMYYCYTGFALSDVSLSIRMCLSTGEWSDTEPLCVPGK